LRIDKKSNQIKSNRNRFDRKLNQCRFDSQVTKTESNRIISRRSLDNSFALRWFLSSRWIIIILDKNVKRNITHSLNFWDLLSMIRIWSVDFKTKWLMMTMKKSSSKYCDNFVKAQTNVVVFNFVAHISIRLR
jgi:hypothetical protein